MTFDLFYALNYLADPFLLLLMAGCVSFGITMGAVPGLTSTLGVALLLSFTFGLDPTVALLMLGSSYCGSEYGGSISAILLKTPGTAAAAATCFDGHTMAQKGMAQEALTTSLISSFLGGIIGICSLLFFSLPLAKISMNFGACEQFWLCVFALTVIVSLSSGNIIKGLIGGLLGLLLACVGMDPVTGHPRLTFNTLALTGGINIVPTLIGLFAIPQAILLVAAGAGAKPLAIYKPRSGVFFSTFLIVLRRFKTVVISSIVGIIVGIMPGAGGNIASFIAYNEAKRFSRTPEDFGSGCYEGIIAPETANNAVVGGAQIPLLTLGIPGSAPAAVFFGALMIHGIKPGFELFTEKSNIVFTYIIGMFVANLLMLAAGSILVRLFAKILAVPRAYIVTSIFCIALAGSFSIRGVAPDVFCMAVAGILGYALIRCGFDVAPIALGLILGETMEEGFKLSLLLGQSEPTPALYLFSRLPSQILIALTLLSLGYGVYKEIRQRREHHAATPH